MDTTSDSEEWRQESRTKSRIGLGIRISLLKNYFDLDFEKKDEKKKNYLQVRGNCTSYMIQNHQIKNDSRKNRFFFFFFNHSGGQPLK